MRKNRFRVGIGSTARATKNRLSGRFMFKSEIPYALTFCSASDLAKLLAPKMVTALSNAADRSDVALDSDLALVIIF